MRAVSYALEEAARSLWRRRGSSTMAVVTIGVSLTVLGAFLLLTINASAVVDRWSTAAELSVYLADDVSDEQRGVVERTLSTSGVVAEHSYVSPAEALRLFARRFPDLATAADSLPANPLPASFEVRLRDELASEAEVDTFASQLRGMPGVADVRYDRQWIERLLGVIRVLRQVGLGLAAVLVLASCLTVTNVVRLALHARRREIDIMHLVGAPLAYIRGPFVAEGLLQGLAGALVALLLLGAGFTWLRGPLQVGVGELIPGSTVRFLPVLWTLLLIVGGAAIGCLGGMIAARGAR